MVHSNLSVICFINDNESQLSIKGVIMVQI